MQDKSEHQSPAEELQAGISGELKRVDAEFEAGQREIKSLEAEANTPELREALQSLKCKFEAAKVEFYSRVDVLRNSKATD